MDVNVPPSESFERSTGYSWVISGLGALAFNFEIAALMNDCLGQNMDLSTIHVLIRKTSLQTLQAFGYSLIMCEYMKLKLQLRHFSFFSITCHSQKWCKSINTATAHSPKSSEMRQMPQQILEAVQWIQSCPEDMFQNSFCVILYENI